MPTYDYECGECGHEFEKFQPITARPVRKCPKCGKAKAKRLIGAGAGIIFKGSGFYQTDYRSESYRKAADSDKPSAPAGEKDKSSSKGGSKASGDSSKASGGKKAD